MRPDKDWGQLSEGISGGLVSASRFADDGGHVIV
jgi:hypothetical protein